jgi:hypothetical protein
MTLSSRWLLALALLAGTARGESLEAQIDRLADSGHTSRIAGLVLDPAVAEISGLAVSRRAPDRLWAINDSDNGNLLHALSDSGRLLGTYTVEGARNHDWEDLAAFELDGEAWLLIADTGDNGGLRKDIELIAVREPDPAMEPGPVPVAWKLRVRWPDGPRDCEALMVDPLAREILLLAKKRVPAQLFRVPLPVAGPSPKPEVAVQIAQITGLPQPTDDDLARAPLGARYMSQITAADLSADGLRMVVLTYREAYLYARASGEAWRHALARPPQSLGMPPLVQAEAIAFDRDARTIWISTERLPAPLIRLDSK